MIGIVDCNNFYASCERSFNPGLYGKPIVILSNNDGCIIARSNEAKKLGLEMGTPLYRVQNLLETNKVAVFSSNYNLYGDMSRRIMGLLSKYTPDLTIYSIDEAFLDLSGMGDSDYLQSYGLDIVQTILRGTGIPVTIGIGQTKTIAKMASKFGKKYPGYRGVCRIDTEEKLLKALKLFPIADVWGIGHRSMDKMNYYGIKSAWDFTQKSESWIRKEFKITGVRTWKELRGLSCINVEDLPHKKSICTSRSFADQGIRDKSILEEAIANFAANCARKLREQHCCCQALTVFAYTSKYRQDLPQNHIYRTIDLQVPTQASDEIIHAALDGLRMDWHDGNFLYKKAGIIVWNICRENAIQTSLFDTVDRYRQAALIKAIDEINRKNGHDTVKVAIQGTNKRWRLKCEHISRQFTTNLNEILKVRTG